LRPGPILADAPDDLIPCGIRNGDGVVVFECDENEFAVRGERLSLRLFPVGMTFTSPVARRIAEIEPELSLLV
jgi:hypothetical protein